MLLLSFLSEKKEAESYRAHLLVNRALSFRRIHVVFVDHDEVSRDMLREIFGAAI